MWLRWRATHSSTAGGSTMDRSNTRHTTTLVISQCQLVRPTPPATTCHQTILPFQPPQRPWSRSPNQRLLNFPLPSGQWQKGRHVAANGHAGGRTGGGGSTKGELYDLLFTIFIQSTHFIPFTYCSLEAATRAVGVDWEGGQAAAALEE